MKRLYKFGVKTVFSQKKLLFLLLFLHRRSRILVLETAYFLCRSLLERLFHHLHRTYLRSLADTSVGHFQEHCFPLVKFFVEFVFAFLVPFDEVVLRLNEGNQFAV